MTEKVTRILHSQGLNRDKYDRLTEIAVLCGQVRADAWQRCSGVSTVLLSPYNIRDAWMAEGYDWHGLPARLGKAALADALGDIAASREASKVPVKKAIRYRTRGDKAERERLYSLLKQNRWTEDPFLHRQMRKQWQGGRSHVTNQIVADSGSYTTKVWNGRAWVYLQGMERGQRIAIPLKGTHLPSGTLRILLQPNGQVAVHYAVDENEVCSTRPCGDATVGVDKGYTEAYTDSDGERHGKGSGRPAGCGKRPRQKVKGQHRNQLRAVAEKHEAKGHHRKADNIRRHNLGRNKWNQRKRQTQKAGAQPAVPGRPRRGRQGGHHRLRRPDGAHEVRPVSPQGHQPSSERLGQGRDGGHTHLDISAQRFCAGLGQSGLHIANRLPHRPVAGPTARGQVSLHRRGCAGRGHQCRLQYSGEAVRRRDYVVHALQGSQGPARRTNQAVGGDCSTRTRVAGACNHAPINRERITNVGTEVCRLMEQIQESARTTPPNRRS